MTISFDSNNKWLSKSEVRYSTEELKISFSSDKNTLLSNVVSDFQSKTICKSNLLNDYKVGVVRIPNMVFI